MSKLKYGSKQVFWDLLDKRVIHPLEAEKYRLKGKLNLPNRIERFDSTLEFKVYQKLIDLVGEKRIVRQHPLLIIPPGYCYPKGKKWRVDFAIRSVYSPPNFTRFVEAKGMVLSEFRHILASLEAHNDMAFDKLRIVLNCDISQGNAFITNLAKTDFKSQMYSLKQFEKLHRLL